MSVLSVGELSASQGEKVSGFVKVTGTEIKLPTTLIAGENKGLGVLVSAGVHGSEYVGIAALAMFCEEIKPRDIAGNIIAIRLMNPSGFENRTITMVHEDGKNLNRVFPGDKAGSVAERIAAFVTDKFFPLADRYVDLHSGDVYESLVPMIFSVGNAGLETVELSMKMAREASVPYMVVSQTGSKGAFNHAGSMGIPSVLLERGQRGIWTPKEAREDVKDLKNILKTLGVLQGKPELREYVPQKLQRCSHLPSPAAGLWYPRKTAGDYVKKGEIAGEIRDYFGKVLKAPAFDYDAVILYQVESLNVLKGENLVTYGGDAEDII